MTHRLVYLTVHDIFLFHQCLWKVVRSLPKNISDVKVDQILLDIHTFLLTHPDQMWKNRADDTPLRTIKTVLYTLGKLKKQEVSKNGRHLISPHNNNTLSNKRVMRITKIINEMKFC